MVSPPLHPALGHFGPDLQREGGASRLRAFVDSGDRISLCVLKRRAQEPAIVSLAGWLADLLAVRKQAQRYPNA